MFNVAQSLKSHIWPFSPAVQPEVSCVCRAAAHGRGNAEWEPRDSGMRWEVVVVISHWSLACTIMLLIS